MKRKEGPVGPYNDEKGLIEIIEALAFVGWEVLKDFLHSISNRIRSSKDPLVTTKKE